MNKFEAANALEKFTKPLVEAIPVLRSVGSLEQAESEARRAIEAARADLVKVQGEITVARNDADEMVRRSNAVVAEANAQRQSIISTAHSEASGIVDAAVIEAGAAIDGAGLRAESIVQDATARADKINAQTADAQAALDGIKALIAEKSVELDEIENGIKKARQKIAAFAGE